LIFGSGHFWIHQIGKKGQKIAGAKKFLTQNQFFDAYQPQKGIFGIHSH